MNRKIFIILFIFMFHLNSLYAEESKEKKNITVVPVKKEKVVIFYFQDKSQADKYGYLSSIIPVSIAADINRIGEYEAETVPVKIDYLDSKSSEQDRNDFSRILTDKNKELKSDFILIGSYAVVDARINILTQIFEPERQKIIPVEGTENKVTAIFVEMIEEHTKKINSELTEASRIRKQERIKEAEEKKAKISPFLGFYNSLSGISFGVSYGTVNLYKSWGDRYENADQVSLNLYYELSNINSIKNTAFFKDIALAGSFNYFSAKTRESYNGMYFLEVTSGALSLSHLFRFTSNFNLGLSAGGGLAKVEVYKEADKVAAIPAEVIDEAYDPLYSFSLSMNFYISNIKIEAGCSYNIIQYSPRQINYSVIYFGLGYRI